MHIKASDPCQYQQWDCFWTFPKLLILSNRIWGWFLPSHHGSESWQFEALSSAWDRPLWDFFWYRKNPPLHIDQGSYPLSCTSRAASQKMNWDLLDCVTQNLLCLWSIFRSKNHTFLNHFLKTSLHKTVTSSSVTQHWWRSRTSRFFKLAKWAAESLKPPPISLLHDMSNFLSAVRCCKAVSEKETTAGWSLTATIARVTASTFIYFNVRFCTKYRRHSF